MSIQPGPDEQPFRAKGVRYPYGHHLSDRLFFKINYKPTSDRRRGSNILGHALPQYY